jgi:Family of unknown function (DUF6314)
MEIDDTFSFLLGRWTLERVLTDHRSGTDGRFGGTAVIAQAQSGQKGPLDPRARYDEDGTLRFGRHTGPASRHLELVRLESAAVMFYLADGTPFVDLDLRGGTWRSIHSCGEDHHEIVSVARSLSEVEEHWRVRGPTTNYDAVAILRRAGR